MTGSEPDVPAACQSIGNGKVNGFSIHGAPRAPVGSDMPEPNDPRVLFAAERTLLAWNRTAISMMAFGFVIERFGMFLEIVGRQEVRIFQRQISFIVGVAFILLSAVLLTYSVVQHKRILRTLRPGEIPARYNTTIGMTVNGIVAFLGVLLSLYLFQGFI